MTPPGLPRSIAVASAAALALLALAWEMWLAPQRPGGSLLALKALPLLAALPAFVRGRVRSYQWWSMLILVYVCEGLVRGVSDPTAMGRLLGWIETALATLAFGAILAHVRAVQRSAAS